jgi:exodeoxyribonuclease-3
MSIASYNINGINGRLDILLRWSKEDKPDVVCLQELKTDDARFPRVQIECRYGAVLARAEILERRHHPLDGKDAILTRRGLPSDPTGLREVCATCRSTSCFFNIL